MAQEWLMEDWKNCAICKELIQIKDFAPNKVRGTYQYNRCRPCNKKRKADWNKDNYERQYEIKKVKMKENPEIYAERRRRYYENNPEKTKISTKAWQERNADYMRYKKNIQNVVYNNNINEKMIKIYNNTCCYCKKELDKDSRFLRPSIDHFIPLISGGTNEIYNLVICCLSCNSSKNSKLPEEFFEENYIDIRNQINNNGDLFNSLYPELSKKLSDIPPFIKLG